MDIARDTPGVLERRSNLSCLPSPAIEELVPKPGAGPRQGLGGGLLHLVRDDDQPVAAHDHGPVERHDAWSRMSAGVMSSSRTGRPPRSPASKTRRA